MKKETKSTVKSVTSIAATGIAAYLAYRVFTKQRGTLNGLLDRVVDGVSSKLKR